MSSPSTPQQQGSNNPCGRIQEFFTLGSQQSGNRITPNDIIECFIDTINNRSFGIINIRINNNNNNFISNFIGLYNICRGNQNIGNVIGNLIGSIRIRSRGQSLTVNTGGVNTSININCNDNSKYIELVSQLKSIHTDLLHNNRPLRNALNSEAFEFLNTCYDRDSASSLKRSLDALRNSSGCDVILALAASYAAMLSSGSRDVGRYEWYPYTANARVLTVNNNNSSIPLCPKWGDVFAILYYLALECLDRNNRINFNRDRTQSTEISRDTVFRRLLGINEQR